MAAARMGEVAAPPCRGAHGGAVDWWVLLKHPQGYSASYLDSSSMMVGGDASSGGTWQHGVSLAPGAANPLAATLAALLPPPTNGTLSTGAGGADSPLLAWALYNDDDPPGREWWEAAHAKGTAAFGADGGFWLVHSAPRYPRPPREARANFSQLLPPQSVFGQVGWRGAGAEWHGWAPLWLLWLPCLGAHPWVQSAQRQQPASVFIKASEPSICC